MKFGGTDESLIMSGDSIDWFSISYTNWWTVSLKDSLFGGNSITGSNSLAIFDTGTSFIAIPSSDYMKLVKKL